MAIVTAYGYSYGIWLLLTLPLMPSRSRDRNHGKSKDLSESEQVQTLIPTDKLMEEITSHITAPQEAQFNLEDIAPIDESE